MIQDLRLKTRMQRVAVAVERRLSPVEPSQARNNVFTNLFTNLLLKITGMG